MNHRKPIDMTGWKLGAWSVLGHHELRARRWVWLCRCVCGTERMLDGGELRRGSPQSCGCLRDRRADRITHGMLGTPTYRTWMCMKIRCRYPRTNGYANYGGRGITVCERWLSFENFLEDMGERPEGKTLDRIDLDGNYEPGNCRWATAIEQQNHKRTSRVLELNGERRTAREWAEHLGMPMGTLSARLFHWPVERALTQPVRKRG